MLKLLITGSTGFIMSNFIRKVVYHKKYQISSIGRMKQINDIYQNKNHEFHIANINEQDTFKTICKIENPDIIIHAAEDDNYLNNIINIHNVLNYCVNNNTKLIYLSKCNLQPIDQSSVSKLTVENIINLNSQYTNLKFNVLKLTSVYGNRQYKSTISNLINCALNQIPFASNESEMEEKDLLNVNDVVSAINIIIDNWQDNKTYNVSSNQKLYNIEIANKIISLTNNMTMSFANNQSINIDVDSSAIRELGWSPEVSFKDGIASTIQWYKNNQWFFKR
jgi:dTDP-glucose 4,6-dehydratase